MRKNLAKVLASASFVVALILIVILLVAAFGGIKAEDFDNGLVHGLLLAISVLYLVIAGTTIALLFIQGEALHEIIIKNGKGESVRVSVGVVKKEVKKACHMIQGVKFKKIALIGDGFGVTLKLSIKVEDKDLDEVEIATRCYIEDCMAKTFGYHFTAIDINIMQLVPKYKANAEEINAEVAKQLEQKHLEEAALEAQLPKDDSDPEDKALEEQPKEEQLAPEQPKDEQPADEPLPAEDIPALTLDGELPAEPAEVIPPAEEEAFEESDKKSDPANA